MLNRIIYISNVTDYNVQIFSDIVVKSIENNVTHELTGMLLKLEDKWIQVLEGTNENLNKIFAKIINDNRHFEVRILGFEQIDNRSFQDWSMKGIEVEDIINKMDNELKSKYFIKNKFNMMEDTRYLLEFMKDIYNLFNN